MRNLTTKDLLLSMNNEIRDKMKNIGEDALKMQQRLIFIENNLDKSQDDKIQFSK